MAFRFPLKQFSLLMASAILCTCILIPRLSQADEREDAFVTATEIRLNEEHERLYYRFSDIVLKKYCASRYDAILNAVYAAEPDSTEQYSDDSEIRTFNLSALLDSEDDKVSELVQECRDELTKGVNYWDHLRIFSDRFENDMNLATSKIISKVEALMANEAATFEQREELAEQVIQTGIQASFVPEKLLSKFEASLPH
jgi:hypothetical protein